ncbi:MAG: hypothetical protein WD993_08560 [Thermoleophilaceae bacterium]
MLRATRCATAVVDVEPVTAPWRSGEKALSDGLAGALRELARAGRIERIVFLTNSRRVPVDGLPAESQAVYVARARKPWRLGAIADPSPPVAVIGDQLLTDGLLAWRLSSQGTPAIFVHWQCPKTHWWPRLQQAAGTCLRPLLFRTPEAR